MAASTCSRCGAALPDGGAGAPASGTGLCPRCSFAEAPTVETPATPVPAAAEPRPTHARGGLIVGTRVGAYTVVGEIGRGGMAVVYRARQAGLERDVALKVLHEGPEGGAPARDRVERFLREARAAAKLSHPNIVPVHEVGESGGLRYFAMEFVPGRGLDQAIREETLDWRRATAIVRDVARAIHYAHGQGIIHRDLKPANILLQPEGAGLRPRVTDFGLARLEGASGLTREGTAIGTPQYMAPEQAAGDHRAVGPATDVYALGAVLYECLTGRPPAVGETVLEILKSVQVDEPPSVRHYRNDVPADLGTVVEKALRKDFRERYPSAEDLAGDLDRVLEGAPISARPLGTLGRAWRGARRHPVAVAGGVALLLGSLALAAGLTTAGKAKKEMARVRSASAEEVAHAAAAGRSAEARREARPAYERACARLSFAEKARRSGDAAAARAALAEAIAAADEALGKAPGYPECLLTRARARALVGDPTGALSDYDAAVREDRDLADAYYERARLRFDRAFTRQTGSGIQGGPEVAAIHADLERLSALGTREERALAARAMLLLLAWDFDGALEALDRALAADRYFADAYALRAAARIGRGHMESGEGNVRGGRSRFKEALADYGRAVEYGADPDSILAGRSEANLLLGHGREALADAERLVALDPGDPARLLHRARVHQARGNRESARRDLEEARRLGGDSPEIRLGAAAVHMTDVIPGARGPSAPTPEDLAAAREQLDWLVQNAKDQPVAHFYRALVNQHEANFTGVADDLRAFLKEIPEDSGFRRKAQAWLSGMEVGAAAAKAEALAPGTLRFWRGWSQLTEADRMLDQDGDLGHCEALYRQALADLESGEPAGGIVIEQVVAEPGAAAPDRGKGPAQAREVLRKLGEKGRLLDNLKKASAPWAKEFRTEALQRARYNLACALSKQCCEKDCAADRAAALRSEALENLEKAVGLGYKDRDHMRNDEDLQALRGEEKFRKLVEEPAAGGN
ncbi:MAG: protein kinase [Planctomycetales bacterium]|nr:protein kinase [Planctomycetales bacterium]